MYTCVLLVPVIWVAMVTQHSFSWRSRMALRRKRRHRKKKQKPKAFGCCEEELEEAGASLETCCPVHLEKFGLAQSLRLVERRLQYVARHLDEVLIPPSVSTSAMSQFSYSSRESTTPALWSPSSFSLREAAMIQSEPLCHTGEIMPVGGWEGSAHPIQAQPLTRPPAHSRRDRGEQTMGLDQTSVRGLDFNIRQKHLQSQLGAPTPYTESLAKMIPNVPALRPPDRDPRVKFNMSRVPFLSCEVLEELDCHVHTKRRPFLCSYVLMSRAYPSPPRNPTQLFCLQLHKPPSRGSHCWVSGTPSSN
ncbi:uncharacterized protein LOC123370805 isoform X1 [Mauremys mutica]|uniref:uncharacterized protein LOC123370805 isoform X1 n=1 Tax=Mauremys mutica TaxID=74926 RepID=UPI001D16899E|nr:uncharacterized protein LOC123370805 isoform X1 [Mauremys mutica]